VYDVPEGKVWLSKLWECVQGIEQDPSQQSLLSRFSFNYLQVLSGGGALRYSVPKWLLFLN